MALFYNKMANNEEIVAMHKEMVKNGLNINVENQDELIEILGGIDYILAYFLQQTKSNINVLNQEQLNQIKQILCKNQANSQCVIPSLDEDINDILDEIEERETKQLIIPIDGDFDDQIDLISNDYNSDQRAVINGYIIINFIEYKRNIPSDIMNDIIDLCVLYTFIPDDNMNIFEQIQIKTMESSKNANQANHGNHANDTCNDKEISLSFGHSQSPINIISSECITNKIMSDSDFSNNPLSFNYPSKIGKCTILNNGHTVQININNECSLCIDNKIYFLKQFHFHTPSEHEIDSKQYEMEMHLVHINDLNEIAVLGFIFSTKQKYNKPKLQLTKSRMHLILNAKKQKSMLMNADNNNKLKIMQESDEESDDLETDDEFDEDVCNKKTEKEKENDFLAQFWDQLPLKKTINNIALKNSLSFDYLFETSSNNFIKNIKTNQINIDMQIFQYMGSLTTPPYTEGVRWLVSKNTHFISYKQLEKLKKCWNNENNARPVQQYFGRKVSLRSKSSLQVIT